MKKKSYFLFTIGMLFLGVSVFAQKTVVVVLPDEGINIGALNNAITSAADPGNTIFELKRGELYLLNGAISHTGYTLHIRAEDASGPRPVLQPAVDELGVSGNHFNPGGDLTLEGLYIQGRDELGAVARRQIIVSGTAPRIVVNDCYFDYSNQAFFRLTTTGCKVFIENSIFRNCFRVENPNNGRIIDGRSNPQDTLSIVNSTLYNFSSRIFESTSFTKLINFDHNTVYQSDFTTGFYLRGALKAKVTNNIFYSFSYRAIGDTHDPLFDVDSIYTVGEFTDADRYFDLSNNNWYQEPEIENILSENADDGFYRFSDWDTLQTDTIWFSYVLRDDLFANQSILDTAVVTPAPILLSFIAAGQVDTSNMFSESLEFTNAPSFNSDYWSFYVGNDYDIGSLDPPNPFADENPDIMGEVDESEAYNFSYSIGSRSATAAEGGLPLGATMWAPYGTVSVEDMQANTIAKISVYPNPAYQQVTFEIESGKFSPVRVSIFDLLGKEIFTVQEQLSKGRNAVFVDLNGIANPGLYIYQVQVELGGGIYSTTTGKLIIK